MNKKEFLDKTYQLLMAYNKKLKSKKLKEEKEIKITRLELEKIFNIILNTLKEKLQSGEKIKWIGFGIFEKIKSSSKKNHVLPTGEKLKIPSAWKVKFKLSNDFKKNLNKRKN